ncbi:MAG: glycine cleavage system aminomethyltransferase GcvT [Actinomycetota bacterium]|jgi:aminomethyltransferase|nr:glycine cleavage system aminomethyltransferase GcvT [Actinomycetota bacterium]
MGQKLEHTPLHAEHEVLGARLVPYAGYEMPVQYSGIIDEHRATRSSVGIFDVSHMAEFRVFGLGAFDFLQGLLTNDLHRIDDLSAAQYTLMCDESGGIIDDLIVYHSGDLEYLIIANAANHETDFEWMKSHCPTDVELADESERTALIAVQGPNALEVIRDLAGPEFEVPDRFHIGAAGLDGVPALIARTGYTGEDGVEILCHADNAIAIWRLLLSFECVTPCGLGARDTLRLEMGYHLYGNDMDRSVDPVTAGLGWTIGKDKTGFVGAEAIVRIREVGPSRKLVGLTVEDGIPRHGCSVLHDGTEVGKVASGTFSPTLEIGIATAYVPVDVATEGTEFEIAIRKKLARAIVTRPPFVKKTSL